MNPPVCAHCPFAGSATTCPRWPTNHDRYCEWIDPESPAFRPDGAAALARIAARRPLPEAPGSFPPLVEQAGNLVGAVARFVASGGEMASAEVQDERRAICGDCPEMVGNRCRLCGCNLGAKIRMMSEHCPVDRW